MDSIDLLTWGLIFTSFLLVLLILNQNETRKDSSNGQSTSSANSPLEIATWIFLSLQMVCLLIKIKNPDF